jgi:hypothetical protein
MDLKNHFGWLSRKEDKVLVKTKINIYLYSMSECGFRKVVISI